MDLDRFPWRLTVNDVVHPSVRPSVRPSVSYSVLGSEHCAAAGPGRAHRSTAEAIDNYWASPCTQLVEQSVGALARHDTGLLTVDVALPPGKNRVLLSISLTYRLEHSLTLAFRTDFTHFIAILGLLLIGFFLLFSSCSLFTALHGMQTRSSDENSVCLSVCLSEHLVYFWFVC